MNAMSLKVSVLAASMAALGMLSAPAAALTLGPDAATEGLTYTLTSTVFDSDSNTFTLDISGINVVGTDTRLGRTGVNAISFAMPDGYTGALLTGWTTNNGGLNNSVGTSGGCSGKDNAHFCFSGNADVTGSTMEFIFQIDAAAGSFASYVPDFKINWLGTQNNYSLVSETFTTGVTPVPEPATYALMLAGLGLIGSMACRRKSV